MPVRRTAIFTYNINKTSETFIRNHILNIGDGETAVICINECDAPSEEFGIPLFKFSEYTRKYEDYKIFKLFNLIINGHQNSPILYKKRKLVDFIKVNNINVILAEYGPLGCIIIPVARELGIPVFVYFRGFDASKYLRRWDTIYSYQRLLLKADGIISVSQHLLDNLSSLGILHPNTHIIPSGVDTSQFKPGNKDPNLIVSIGRFVEKKAPHITIEAFSEVSRKYPLLRLEMVGDGVLLGSCIQLARELGIENKVIFHRSKNHSFIKDLLSRATIFLLHSVTASDGDTEGLPSVIQEALSSGTVVISTRHAGIPEAIINGKTGFIVDEFDLNNYVNTIIKLISKPELIEQISRNSTEVAVKKYDLDRNLKRLEQIIG